MEATLLRGVGHGGGVGSLPRARLWLEVDEYPIDARYLAWRFALVHMTLSKWTSRSLPQAVGSTCFRSHSLDTAHGLVDWTQRYFPAIFHCIRYLFRTQTRCWLSLQEWIPNRIVLSYNASFYLSYHHRCRIPCLRSGQWSCRWWRSNQTVQQ